jgi:hypothetical protein
MKRLFVTIILFCISLEFSFAQVGMWIVPGNEYYILQYRANVRKNPSLESPVVAILFLGNIVEVLERAKGDRINNYYEAWYKIKYGKIIGYVFGGNLAHERLITDIDNNGIKDFFSYRSRGYYYSGQDVHRDIFIYINNQRLNTSKLNTYSSDYKISEPDFGWCEFEEQSNHVIMKLSLWGNLTKDGKDFAFKNIYKINSNGTIEFVDWEFGNIRGHDYRKIRTKESDLQKPPGDWEWYTLEAYERYIYKDDQYIKEIVISDDGQIWLKTIYTGK